MCSLTLRFFRYPNRVCERVQARELLDDVGVPLELDTDGIWTLLPDVFPELYEVSSRLNPDKK